MKQVIALGHKYCFWLGIVVIVLSIILPDLFGPTMRPLAYATLFVCPALGLLGGLLALYHKSFGYFLGNLCLIFSFGILWFVGTLIFGP
ncbi:MULTISPECIES: hypothetical protein [Aerococcus]|uniref:hypothetical protein n=1 Tax=Aerococcus TaxID=1375 RepID=UPI00117EF92A|nr:MULTISPECIES: hypothetical protein [Aerococcus]MCY3067850.1 hypothetical protein [Aerococcus mictus]MCY3080663.1 hypothetical protein [Aerococcus mictus]MDK7910204.1 hypothetical protein [Aerococcus urinae]MDK8610060.1 hypothetical protein [Aerococcus urinae]WIK92453.1 hypothetical protein CJ190_008875 [Aerococcus loyolae]